MISHDLYTVAQVRRIDQQVIAQQFVAGYTLMQRAAVAAFTLLQKRWPAVRSIVVLCGSGNNGGDGYLLALLAHQAGLHVDVLALGTAKIASDAARAHSTFHVGGGTIISSRENTLLPPADMYVDALFGTGLTRPPSGIAAALITQLNASDSPVLSLDIPSGVNGDTGCAQGVAVQADVTLSFVAHKRGLFTADALDYRGELLLDTLAACAPAYANETADACLLDMHTLDVWLAPRKKNVHKGLFGHVLAIGGDHGMAGAIRLAAEAALRCGAGLVSVATRGGHVPALNAARSELMAQGVEDAQALEHLLPRISTLALGPGLGQRAWGHALWHTALDSGKSQVVDADALNMLALQPRLFSTPTVLTPHPSEAARLLECSTAEIQSDRFSAARKLAKKFNAVVVLKGAGSLICAPEGQIRICPFGNPGMAVAGMGDVLTGVIAALLAQHIPAWPAAQLGVALHALAGDAAAKQGQRGLLASDLFPHLRLLANGIKTNG
jgi:hydroxyethylthiazole kinase-like uncharacterized protein yjeF